MKFNCGPTPEEREAIAVRRILAERARLTDWHPWFAWRPTRVGPRDCRWLEWIKRRGRWYSTAPEWYWKGPVAAERAGYYSWEYCA